MVTEASTLIEKEIGDRLVEVTKLLLNGEQASASLSRVTQLACRSIPRCNEASILLFEGTAIDTAVLTSDTLRPFGEIQMRSGDGPSLRAIRDGRPHTFSVEDGDHEPLSQALVAAELRS